MQETLPEDLRSEQEMGDVTGDSTRGLEMGIGSERGYRRLYQRT